jgi:hypothetical protein
LVEASARQPVGRMAVRADDVQSVVHGPVFRGRANCVTAWSRSKIRIGEL